MIPTYQMVDMTTRDTLLQTAETLVRRKGMDAFSFADLAKAASIQKASVHYHFPTKADLAVTLVEDYAQRFLSDLARIDRQETTAGSKLIAYLKLYRRALAGGKQLCLCVAMSASRDSFNDDVLAHLKQFHAQSVDWLVAVFEKAKSDGSIEHVVDATAEAKATLALVQGAQLLARERKNARAYDEATELLARRVRHQD